MCAKHRRAEPLSPEARRRAIVDAVIPLLMERGAAVTTREMAEAAGIAEGTIFKVFPDKSALIHEAVRVSFDPEQVRSKLAEIYPEAPLEIQVAEAARLLIEWFEGVISVISVLRTVPHSATEPAAGPPSFVAEANAAINEAIAVIFERHRDQLRIEPLRAASALRGLLLASSHPTMSLSERLTIDEIVQVLLGGIVVPLESAVL